MGELTKIVKEIQPIGSNSKYDLFLDLLNEDNQSLKYLVDDKNEGKPLNTEWINGDSIEKAKTLYNILQPGDVEIISQADEFDPMLVEDRDISKYKHMNVYEDDESCVNIILTKF